MRRTPHHIMAEFESQQPDEVDLGEESQLPSDSDSDTVANESQQLDESQQAVDESQNALDESQQKAVDESQQALDESQQKAMDKSQQALDESQQDAGGEAQAALDESQQKNVDESQQHAVDESQQQAVDESQAMDESQQSQATDYNIWQQPIWRRRLKLRAPSPTVLDSPVSSPSSVPEQVLSPTVSVESFRSCFRSMSPGSRSRSPPASPAESLSPPVPASWLGCPALANLALANLA